MRALDHAASREGRRHAQRPRGRILIVEDDALISLGIEQILVRAGHEVVGTATDACGAIRRAEEASPDLALMDIRLRGKLDGVAAAAALRERFDLPSIFVSGNSDIMASPRAAQVQPIGRVVKPFSDRELLQAIDRALAKLRSDRPD